MEVAMTHLLRCGRPGRWLAAPWLLAVAACSSDRHPTAPGPRPAFDISDAVHGGGTPGFFFLPPLVAQPTTGGEFDADIATLNPQVAICDVTLGPDVDCGGSSEGATPAIVVFTTTSTSAITVAPTASAYSVNWDTKLDGFVTGHTYRAHVAAGGIGARRELGFADLLLTTSPGQVKDLATGDLISLNDGRTLPIRFRIESGIPGALAVTAASASIPTDGTDLITAMLQDLHGAPLAGATVAWSVTADVGAAGTPPLDVTSGQTDAAGMTATTFRAGATAGTAVVAAAAAGLSGSATVSVTGRVVGKPLYVANTGANSITGFAAGATPGAVSTPPLAPAAAIVGDQTGLSSPSGLALDAAGRIYVTNQGDLFGANASVEIFSSGVSGNATPLVRIAGGSTGLIAPAGIALDAAANIYVPNANAAPADITVYAAAANGD